MAFPVVSSVTPTLVNTASTSHNVAMPATVDAGDLLIVALALASSGSNAVTLPTDWNLIRTDGPGQFGTYYKIAVGNEDGTTVDFVSTNSVKAAAHCYRITSWHGTTPPETTIAIAGTSTNPNPPQLTPSWGAEDTLWLIPVGIVGVTTVSAYSTNYTNGEDDSTTTGAGATVAYARRDLNATTDNPDNWTIGSSFPWIAQTVAVRPGAGAGTVTGTIAVTQAADVGAASGTVLNPITGTVAATQASNTGAFVGSLNISGSIAVTQAPDTGAISGTVANPISGSIGVTQGDDTGAISGTVASPAITGTIAVTQADDTGAITGTSTSPAVTGTIAAAQDDQTGAFTATLGISGTVAATQDSQTMAASGIAAFGVVGTIGVTQAGDTFASSGTVINPITGVLGATQDDDSGSFNATVIGAITGTLASTQANQTMTATGSVVNLVAGAVVSVTCTIGGPTLACTISPVSVIAGSNFIVTATFRDAMGDLANPTSVTSVIQAPDGTQSTPTPTSSSVGVWTTVVPTDQAGFWFYQISGEGNEIDVVCHGSVCVEPALVLV